ncbi:amidohydrolase [Limnoglobus roseus]|uniref:Amidohydrolase n=1 Tax=Limnoglobus roseus TaxID=2598579 RepID=A0A5C1AF83_9BACT|nr:amidohydrolase [Limnoglobus roseus]QEL18079.1 amidohydrolase [Limnoglobus roseus]
MTRCNILLISLLLLATRPGSADPPKPEAVKPDVKPLLALVDGKVETEIKSLIGLYTHFHTHPELSLHEVESAAKIAEELRGLGFTVTEKVGGTGVVAVLKNGPGPTVLVRADMDALPVTEQTGVPYASKVRTKNREGIDVGVMHACGHDIHMANLIGTARVLTSLKDRWAGTLMLIAQPAEEIGAGARAMLEDGLFKRFPKPDYCLALHSDALAKIGTVRYSEGLALANVDTVDVTVYGRGGHGASPHTTIDPIVLASRIVLDLQTIVSREVNPTDPAVVTVGSIHGGTKHNIIPNEVKLQITVRSTKDTVRDHVLKAIDRICKAAADGARAPAPTVKVNLDEYTPSTLNDVALTRKTIAVFREILDDKNVIERPPIMGGEDFGRYGREGVPIFMYFLGTIPDDRFAESERPAGKPLPSMHSDSYAPAPEPSLRTGVRTMSMAVLNLMKK